MRFSFDGDDRIFLAEGAGPTWNGWVCPVVNLVTLRSVNCRLGELSEDRVVEFAADAAGVATVTELEVSDDGGEYAVVNTSVIRPNDRGLYLLDMGLTLVER